MRVAPLYGSLCVCVCIIQFHNEIRSATVEAALNGYSFLITS